MLPKGSDESKADLNKDATRRDFHVRNIRLENALCVCAREAGGEGVGGRRRD